MKDNGMQRGRKKTHYEAIQHDDSVINTAVITRTAASTSTQMSWSVRDGAFESRKS